MKTKAQKQAEQQADEVIAIMASIRESIDHLIELFENQPEGEPNNFGEVL